MNFDEWHESQTHKAYNSLDCPHYAWEKAAWEAAIDEAVKVANESATEKVNDNFIYDADVGEKIKELKA